ncbi:MAG: ssl1498 family light-harvesting-like protein [Coleofasciculaceae cyanobacterium]
MPYTTEEGGRFNNFAPETKTYIAEPPTKEQKRNYLVYGIAAFALVSSLIFVAYSASNVS